MEFENSLKDKTIIITGANCGIGYEAALDFARRGARLIIACRNQTRADQACEKIKSESKNPNIAVELLDLASLKSTREFSDRILAKLDRLDILVNNAGVNGFAFQKTEDGFETHLATNYLGHYLLTRLLLNLLKKSAPSRIINVSSLFYRNYGMNWDDLNLEKDFTTFYAYGQSKLAQVMFTVELEKRLKGTGVSAVVLHPGIVATEITRKREGASFAISLLMTVLRTALRFFGATPTDGAKSIIHCATHPDIPDQSGSYFNNNSNIEEIIYKNSDDKGKTEQLWDMSAELVGLDENV